MVNNQDDELPDEIYEKVTALSEQGNVLLEAHRPADAIKVWQNALSLLPEPQHKWEAALWLHASIGEAERIIGNMQAALSAFQEAASSSDGEGVSNPFVLLGLGTCLFDLDRKKEAVDPLLRAYMLEGDYIFAESDPKYLQYLKEKELI